MTPAENRPPPARRVGQGWAVSSQPQGDMTIIADPNDATPEKRTGPQESLTASPGAGNVASTNTRG